MRKTLTFNFDSNSPLVGLGLYADTKELHFKFKADNITAQSVQQALMDHIEGLTPAQNKEGNAKTIFYPPAPEAKTQCLVFSVTKEAVRAFIHACTQNSSIPGTNVTLNEATASRLASCFNKYAVGRLMNHSASKSITR